MLLKRTGKITPFVLGVSLIFFSCKNEQGNNASELKEEATTAPIQKPDFNPDSAFAFIEQQLSFGPRVPGTPAQKKCAAWLEEKLRSYCDTVYVQQTRVKAGDGSMLPCINLIGSINPGASRRILLLSHWDSRPWADMDSKNPNKPILAADDGASGVAVLLEIARQIQMQPITSDLGIDILLTDVEDYGRTEWGENSYALGTQYWAKNRIPAQKQEFGILLDMVGARDARFHMESYSARYAPHIQQKVWQAAGKVGYSSYFPFVKGDAITDDHVFINEIAGIPTIDIINLNSRSSESAFAAHWHTHDDDISIIDKNTLEAVGETLLQVIYELSQPL